MTPPCDLFWSFKTSDQGWTKVFIRPFVRWNRNFFWTIFGNFWDFEGRDYSKDFRTLEKISKKIFKKIPENYCKIYSFKKKSPKKFPESCKISFTLRAYVLAVKGAMVIKPKPIPSIPNQKNQILFTKKLF